MTLWPSTQMRKGHFLGAFEVPALSQFPDRGPEKHLLQPGFGQICLTDTSRSVLQRKISR